MVRLDLFLNGDNALADYKLEDIIESTEAVRIAVLDHGMQSGAPSVSICIPLPDGKIALCQTTLRLFQTVARATVAKYGDLTT